VGLNECHRKDIVGKGCVGIDLESPCRFGHSRLAPAPVEESESQIRMTFRQETYRRIVGVGLEELTYLLFRVPVS
jgi:hypothetical protein